MTAPESGTSGPAYGHGAAPAGPAAAGPGMPPLPQGTGVRPPFSAPPVHKEGTTVLLWSILGAFALLLCLVGGGIGAGGAVMSAFNETDQEAQEVAAKYLDAIAEQRFSDAYQMTCGPLRRKVDEQEFVAAKRQGGRLVDYQLSTIQLLQDGDIMVPAQLDLEGGGSTRVGLVMAREPVDGASTGPDAKSEFRVCGEVDNPAPAPS